MTDFYQEAKQLLPELVSQRREFHRNPELGGAEYRTAKAIEDRLDGLNIPHRRVGETGVLGILRGNRPGSGVIALRADIDALPIQETNQVEYRSCVDGVMHACGHDAHTTCLLGGARLLAAHRDEFGGEIRLIFQPGEEIGKGACDFIDSGVMEGVQRVFGLHTAHEIPAGTVSLTPGLNNAAVDRFRITVHGKSAHVSTPQLGADALYVASHIVIAVQALVTRRTSPVEPALIGIGKLRAGTAYNALAETAELEGTTRTITQTTREQLRTDIFRTAEQVAALYGATVELEWAGIASVLNNDPQVCREAIGALKPMMPDVVFSTERPFSLAGDNFADFQLTTPGAYAYLGSGNPEMPGTQNPAHNGNFDIDESTLSIGAALYAGYAYWWLRRNETDNWEE